mmetsp:Transcript_31769/g.52520  ORF Transcript_31769/g.52520 Transcript_31769/m.52520 type:complete len:89 (-) Transcript_31769:539-805(-)
MVWHGMAWHGKASKINGTKAQDNAARLACTFYISLEAPFHTKEAHHIEDPARLFQRQMMSRAIVPSRIVCGAKRLAAHLGSSHGHLRK